MSWQEVFYTNIPTYISLINQELSRSIPVEPIGKYIKVIGGYSFKSGEYQNKGVPVIRISDFQNEEIDLSNVRYYKEDTKYSQFELKEGDIIIAMTGGTIGKLAIVQKGLGKLYLNQRVGKFLIVKPELFIAEYIYWIARGVQEHVKNMGYGGAQPNIGNAQIEALKFPFPNVVVQKKIVAFLSDLKNNTVGNRAYFNEVTEKRILKLQQNGISIATINSAHTHQTELIKKLRQSILQEAVQGKLVPQVTRDEPASELLKIIKAEKEKLISEGKVKKEKPLNVIPYSAKNYELPVGWVYACVEQIAYCLDFMRRPINKMERRKNQGNIPYYGANGQVDTIGDFLFDESLVLVLEDETFIGRTKPFSYLISGKSWVNNHAHVLKPAGKITPEYLNLLLSFYNFPPLTSGTTNRQKLNKETLLSIMLPIAPLAEQHRIIAKVEELMQLCDRLENEVNTSKQNAEKLMQSVLREAFENGKNKKQYPEPKEKLSVAAEPKG